MKITNEGWAVIENDNYLSNDIIVQKRLDVAKDFLEQFRQYIPVGGRVVDVGASLGDTAATFSEMVGEGGIVVAYEPNPPTFMCLLHNMKQYPNVLVSHYGLGANLCAANVDVDHNNIGASRLVPDPLLTSKVAEVTVRNLDSLADQWTELDFIKIDAEGWEPLILDGAAMTINRFRPAMLIEVNTWPLGKMNFTPEDIYSRLDALNYSYPKTEGPYGDILCLPKERT